MTYCLFIDDERFPPADDRPWVIARTLDDVVKICNARGAPFFVSFDHDLGDHTPSGHDIAKAMVESDLDGGKNGFGFTFIDGFYYTIHSQNPVGGGNISGLLDGYLSQKE
jgi:hypothetical protein